MQTRLPELIKNTPEGIEADSILRTCVHCGFCLAACPTYQLLGDELDSPRGRIYLIKQMLEGAQVTKKTQLHLDRCLTCRSCETACPSGVRYGHLLDIGRNMVERKVGRSPVDGLIRKTLKTVLPDANLFNPLLKMGQALHPWLPGGIKKNIPSSAVEIPWPAVRHERRMLVLDGCVQPGLAPNINGAAAHILDRLGISLLYSEKAGCCGGISYHLNAREEGLNAMRRNVDAWVPYLDDGFEAIVTTASGCGVTVREYGHLLRHDPAYADKAARVSEATKDIVEVLLSEKNSLENQLKEKRDFSAEHPKNLAFHSPCTLQHGQGINGAVEEILAMSGFRLTEVPDGHLCCGSAGTYSILQQEMSQRLLANKVAALESGSPDMIVTANIGCLVHLQSGTSLSVKHWIELLNDRLAVY